MKREDLMPMYDALCTMLSCYERGDEVVWNFVNPPVKLTVDGLRVCIDALKYEIIKADD